MLPHPEIDFRRTPVTLLVAAVAVAIELVCTFDPGRRELYKETWRLGMLSTVWSGELWRPVTTTLIHGGLIHAVFNVYWLVTFGRVIEPFFGSARYLLVLGLLAVTSTMPSFLVNNWSTPLDGQISGVGLSGVIYGLFGLLWVGRNYRPAFRDVLTPEVVQLLIAWFVFCIFLTYLDVLAIDNVAHGAGCAVGVLYGLALFEPKRRLAWRSAAVAVTLLAIGSMFAAPGHPLYEKHVEAVAHNRAVRQLEEMDRVRIVPLEPTNQPPREEPQGGSEKESPDEQITSP